ncbi:tetratricopeptide repeat protein [Undibacterium sp. Ren11W]|uniref:tetratricopeptide repeat protein n=1 Tax=Undibacterium sp. Ren11W TaxID=3413045 RepID=UPI003BF37752
MRHFIIAFLSFSLLACASPKPQQGAQYLLNDQLFAPTQTPIDAENIFALNDEMRLYLEALLNKKNQNKSAQLTLFEALRNQAYLRIEYDSAMTKKAVQTFESRSGNCLSLVIMTAALAKQLKLTVQYQNVDVEQAWSSNGDLHFSAGHVNIILGKKDNIWREGYDASASLLIDFLPPDELRGQKAKQIHENTIVAMYMNNRAAELLANKQIDDAYWFAREAILRDPEFLSAYNTMGVIYLRHHNLPQAEQNFRAVLLRDQKNTMAMHNLAATLGLQERQPEAALWQAQLKKLQPSPPFYYLNLGKLAMDQGDYQKAKALFLKELERDPYYHELHFWLGLAHFHLGELKLATEQLISARDNSTSSDSYQLYRAKLDRINSSVRP